MSPRQSVVDIHHGEYLVREGIDIAGRVTENNDSGIFFGARVTRGRSLH